MSRNKLQVHIARLMALCLVLLLILPAIPAKAAVSGGCGDDVTWTYEAGVLTIAGSSAIRDYSELAPAPWAQYADQISTVIVKQGVQAVGAFAFFGLKELISVTLPNSVRGIGTCAFYGCKKLTMVNMTGVTQIGDSAFEQCVALKTIRLPGTLQSIGAEAFYRCENLISITIPVSVKQMGGAAFAYCHNLRTAIVLANMTELPHWMFYGCYALKDVQLSTKIEGLGEKSFNGTKVEKPVHSNKLPEISIEDTQTETKDDSTVTTDIHYRESEDCVINTVVTTVNKGGQKETQVKIDAVLDADNGWQKVEDAVSGQRYGAENVNVNIWMTADTHLKGEDLGRFSGENVKLTIQTIQGTKWHVNGSDLVGKELSQRYDLSFTLKRLTNPDEKQAQTLIGRDGFLLEFHGVLDFKVEVELPIGKNYNHQSAVFFSPEEDGYQRKQAVMIDDEGMAHFYLGHVDANVEHLIGINVPQKVEQGNQNLVSDVIIPDSLKHEYPQIEQIGQIEYVVTGVKSSLGINIGQLTFFLIAGMIICAVVIGVVMRILYKRKLKSGYTPDMRYTDEL